LATVVGWFAIFNIIAGGERENDKNFRKRRT
jgi:hypothetical protein